ncbi:hypothetical protein ACS0TY_000812 [Phlomoides rotata]
MGSSKSFGVILFFLLFVSLDFDGTIIRSGEAAACISSSPSKSFKGPCLVREKCKRACYEEGYDDGKCKGIQHPNPKCICYIPCPPTFS